MKHRLDNGLSSLLSPLNKTYALWLQNVFFFFWSFYFTKQLTECKTKKKKIRQHNWFHTSWPHKHIFSESLLQYRPYMLRLTKCLYELILSLILLRRTILASQTCIGNLLGFSRAGSDPADYAMYGCNKTTPNPIWPDRTTRQREERETESRLLGSTQETEWRVIYLPQVTYCTKTMQA